MASSKYVCTLSKEFKCKAKEELNEYEERRDADIQTLRNRVIENKALNSKTDSEFLLRFLRARKFDQERSYKLVENYYRVRAENAEHFSDLKPSSVQGILTDGVVQVLPFPDKFGRKIIYFRPGKWDPSKHPIHDMLRVTVLNVEIALREETTQVNGVVWLYSAAGVSFDQVRHVSRQYVRLYSSVLQEAMPLRVKAILTVHEPALVQYVFAIVKPFLKRKISARVQFNGSNVSKLLSNEDNGLTPDILPKELGGFLPTGDELAKEWAKEAMGYEEVFEDMLKYNIDLTAL